MEGEQIDITDLHLRSGILYVREGKGRKRREVPVSERVIEDFKNYLYQERSDYLTDRGEQAFLLNHNGKRMRAQQCRRRLKVMIKKAGLPADISLHSLRHSVATHLLQNGMAIEFIRDFLGHKYLETTQIYTQNEKL